MISAIISSVVLLAVVVMYVLTTRRFDAAEVQSQEIHKLVNSQLTAALDSIEALQKKVENLGGPKAPPVRDRGDH